MEGTAHGSLYLQRISVAGRVRWFPRPPVACDRMGEGAGVRACMVGVGLPVLRFQNRDLTIRFTCMAQMVFDAKC